MFDIDKIRVAAPCSAGWDAMIGDDKIRLCQDCGLNVHNLERMTAHEVRELIGNRNGRLCIRLFRRADGTVITKDCPTGLRAVRRRVARFAGAALSAVLGLVSISYAQKAPNGSGGGRYVQISRDSQMQKKGSIAGTVRDPNGAVVPGLKLVLRIGDKKVRTIRADDNGVYSFEGLDVRSGYSITVETKSTGFARLIVQSLSVKEGQKLVLDLELPVAEGIVTVGLITEEDLIDMGSSTVETTISGKKLETMRGGVLDVIHH